MGVYKTGTVSVTNGSDQATFAGGAAILQNILPGDTLYVGAAAGVIKSRESETAATLELPWGGATAAGASYVANHTGSGWQSAVGFNGAVNDFIELLETTQAGVIKYLPWTDVASAATTDLGAVASNLVRVTGAVGIASLGTAAAGVHRIVRFAGIVTLTHSANLILPGAQNFVSAAGDTILFVSEGGGIWRAVLSQRAGGSVSLSDIAPIGALRLADWLDVASAATTDIGAALSNLVRVTGTTGITSLGIAAAGTHRIVRFAGIVTLTHSANLILPGAQNFVSAAGDAILFVSEGSGVWRAVLVQRAGGAANLGDIAPIGALRIADWLDVASAATADIGAAASNLVRVTGATTITAFDNVAANVLRWVRFAAALTLTHSANLILPGGANIATAAGDVMLVKSDGGGIWRCLAYERAAGKPLIGPASTDISDSTATGRSAVVAANAAALANAAGLGVANSPTFTALTLSNGQLAFPASQVPSSNPNILDDYEEGTFTPTFTAATPPTGVAHASQSGKYTKNGNVVTFYAGVSLSSKGAGGAGSPRLGGLPFVGAGVSPILVAFWSSFDLAASYTMLCGFVIAGTSHVEFYSAGDNVATGVPTWANASDTTALTVSGFYFV